MIGAALAFTLTTIALLISLYYDRNYGAIPYIVIFGLFAVDSWWFSISYRWLSYKERQRKVQSTRTYGP